MPGHVQHRGGDATRMSVGLVDFDGVADMPRGEDARDQPVDICLGPAAGRGADRPLQKGTQRRVLHVRDKKPPGRCPFDRHP